MCKDNKCSRECCSPTFWCGCVSGDLLKIVTMLLRMKEEEVSSFVADTETHRVSSL